MQKVQKPWLGSDESCTAMAVPGVPHRTITAQAAVDAVSSLAALPLPKGASDWEQVVHLATLATEADRRGDATAAYQRYSQVRLNFTAAV